MNKYEKYFWNKGIKNTTLGQLYLLNNLHHQIIHSFIKSIKNNILWYLIIIGLVFILLNYLFINFNIGFGGHPCLI